MAEEDIKNVKAFILEELIKKGKFGSAHMPLDSIIRHLPDMLLHDKKGRKAVDCAIKELANLRWITVQKKQTGKGSGLHVSINPKAVKEISEFIGLKQA